MAEPQQQQQKQESPRRQFPLFTISLKDDFSKAGSEQRKLLDATMDQIVSEVITEEPPTVLNYLKTLYELCMRPVEMREVIYQLGEALPNMEKRDTVFDTNITLLMREESAKNGTAPSTADIIGFMSYGLMKGPVYNHIHLTQCSVAPQYRKCEDYIKALIQGLIDMYGPDYSLIRMRASPEKVALYLRCGFSFGATRAENIANTELYKQYSANGSYPRNISDGTVNLYLCITTYCRQCHIRIKDKLNFCGLCHNVSYCNTTCQANDFANHKIHCEQKAIKKL